MRKSVLVVSAVTLLAVPVLFVMSGSNEERAPALARDIHDNATSREVKAVLIEAFGPDALGIVVGVEENVAVLSGDVRERPTQKLAQQVAESVGGIIVAHNFLHLIDVDADDAGAPDRAARDLTLRARLASELASDIGDEAPGIAVDACDGVVLLRGDLPDNRYHDTAVRIAESLSGVRKVIDLLHVAWTGSVAGLPHALSHGSPGIDTLTPIEGEK